MAWTNDGRRLDGQVVQTQRSTDASTYVLRHTCASLMAQQGVPVTTAAAIMGHDPAMFLRVYAHLCLGDLRAAAAVLDAARTTELGGSCGADVVQALHAENSSHPITL